MVTVLVGRGPDTCMQTRAALPPQGAVTDSWVQNKLCRESQSYVSCVETLFTVPDRQSLLTACRTLLSESLAPRLGGQREKRLCLRPLLV